MIAKLTKMPLHILIPTIISVAIVIIAFGTVLGIREGIKVQLTDTIQEHGMGTYRLVVKRGDQWNNISQEQYYQLKEIDVFRGVTGETIRWTLAESGDRYLFNSIGVTSDYFQVKRYPLALGREFNHQEVENGEQVVVIGSTLKDKIFPTENPIGQYINHFGIDYKIIGVLDEVESKRTYESLANQTVFFPYLSVSNIPMVRRSMGTLTQIWLDVGDLSVDELEKIIRDENIFPENVTFDFVSQTDVWDAFYVAKKKILDLLTGASIVIVLLAGMNVMMVSLASLKRELYQIGIQKAVGASGKDIFLYLLQKSFSIFLIGGLMGVGLLVALQPLLESLTQEMVYPGVNSLFLLFIALLGVGVVTSLYPAYLGFKLSPIDALYQRGGLVKRLKHDVSRKFFVLLGVALSIVAITLVFILGGGLIKQVDDLTAMFSKEIIVLKNENIVNDDFLQPAPITYELYEILEKELTEAQDLTILVERFENVYVNDERYEMVVCRVKDNFFSIMGMALQEGEFFSSDYEVVLGSNVADFINKKSIDSLMIERDPHYITGVLEEVPTEVGGFRRYDYGNYIFKPFSLSSVVTQNYQIIIKAKEGVTYEKLAGRIEEISQKLYPDFGAPGMVRPIERNQQYRDKFVNIRKVCLLYGIVSLLVSGIGVMNLMLVTVGSRMKELGIRRTVGATRLDILRMLLVESIVTTSLGGFIGVVCGIAFAFYISKYFVVNFYISPWLMIPVILFSIGTGILAGLYPAYRASRVNPIQVLKPVEE